MVDFEEFREIRSSYHQAEFERYEWVKEQEKSYNVENISLLNHIRQLYWDSTRSFMFGNYLASILCIGSTIEEYLRRIVELSKYDDIDRVNFAKLIREAGEQHLISENLREQLQYFRENIRNHVAHPKTFAPFTFLGLEYQKEDKSWGKESGRTVNPNTATEDCAKEGIKLFLSLVKETIGRKWKNLR